MKENGNIAEDATVYYAMAKVSNQNRVQLLLLKLNGSSAERRYDLSIGYGQRCARHV